MSENFTEKTINQHQYNLSFAQQDLIEKSQDSLSLIQLTRTVFQDDSLDERTMEYHNVRRFVAKLKRGVPTIEFTAEQVEFINNNAHVIGPFEMAKTLFPDRDVKPLSKETQTIKLYLDAIGASEEDDSKQEKYRPPKSNTVIARKINKADSNANFDSNDLSPFQTKCVESLRSYLQSIRFLAFINIVEEEDLREMFEEEFIKGVYDKPDLNTEELNMYITLCAEYVNIHRLEKQKAMLSAKIDRNIEDSGDDEKQKKLFYTWVEMYKEREEALHKAKARAEKLQTNLSSTRSRRLEKLAQVNDSLSRFVEEWKSEEGRKRALVIAEAKNMELEEEIGRISSMEEYIANIMGTSKDELINN